MKSPVFHIMAVLFLAASTLLAYAPAQATVLYETQPSGLSQHVSHHTAGGPVLADDFTPLFSGLVTSVEWWGSPALTGGADLWEITFHADAGGTPFAGILSQHILSASGSDADGDGIYHYIANWLPQDLSVTAGVGYWFSVANASGSSWTWALGNSATVGSESFDAMVSNTALGSPHFGPWTALTPGTDFAFRINGIPAPGTVLLFSVGLFLVGFLRKI